MVAGWSRHSRRRDVLLFVASACFLSADASGFRTGHAPWEMRVLGPEGVGAMEQQAPASTPQQALAALVQRRLQQSLNSPVGPASEGPGQAAGSGAAAAAACTVRIALVNAVPFHFEIVGGFLHVLREYKVSR